MISTIPSKLDPLSHKNTATNPHDPPLPLLKLSDAQTAPDNALATTRLLQGEVMKKD